MEELLLEYRQTKKETVAILEQIKVKILRIECEIEGLSRRSIVTKNKLRDEIKQLENDKSIILSWISNLEYSIRWMSSGRRPGSLRGIENRAAYDREIPVDPYWLQLNSDEDQITLSIDDEGEKGDIDQEQLLKEITKSLNKKEKEILVMSANHMSIRRISTMTRIPRSTVHDILKKCKKKIEDEGWMIV